MKILDVRNCTKLTTPLRGKILVRNEIRSYSNRSGPGTLFSALLIDETAEIKVCFFGRNLNDSWQKCTEGNAVNLHGVEVKTADQRYNFAENLFELNVNVDKGGFVEEAEDFVCSPHYRFHPISELATIGTNGVRVDLLGVVISTAGPTDVQTRNGPTQRTGVVLADNSDRTALCTFWGRRAVQVSSWHINSIVAIKGARTSDYDVLSLSCSSVYCVLDPDGVDLSELQKWREERAAKELMPVAASRQPQIDDAICIDVPSSVKRVRIRRGNIERTIDLNDSEPQSSQQSDTSFSSQ